MKRVISSPLNYSRPNGRTTDHTGTADRTLIEYKSCLEEGINYFTLMLTSISAVKDLNRRYPSRDEGFRSEIQRKEIFFNS
jgi:hypothetical protein